MADPFITVDNLADQQEQFVDLHDVLDEELYSDHDDVLSQDSQTMQFRHLINLSLIQTGTGACFETP